MVLDYLAERVGPTQVGAAWVGRHLGLFHGWGQVAGHEWVTHVARRTLADRVMVHYETRRADCAYACAHLLALPVDAGLGLRALGADHTLRLTGGRRPPVAAQTGTHGREAARPYQTLGVGAARVRVARVGRSIGHGREGRRTVGVAGEEWVPTGILRTEAHGLMVHH